MPRDKKKAGLVALGAMLIGASAFAAYEFIGIPGAEKPTATVASTAPAPNGEILPVPDAAANDQLLADASTVPAAPVTDEAAPAPVKSGTLSDEAVTAGLATRHAAATRAQASAQPAPKSVASVAEAPSATASDDAIIMADATAATEGAELFLPPEQTGDASASLTTLPNEQPMGDLAPMPLSNIPGIPQFGGGVTPPQSITPPASPVPEPSTWALVITGFGLVGHRLRRRTHQRATA